MAKTSTILKTSGVIIVLLFLFGMWYKFQYSMDHVPTKEINNPAEFSTHILIATQGSEFKNAVLDEMVKTLTVMEPYIKIIDVSLLEEIDYKDWDAICIMHTWEQWRAPKSVEQFVKRLPDQHDVVILTTSGTSDSKMFEVDGITSASELTEVESVANQLVSRIKAAMAQASVAQ